MKIFSIILRLVCIYAILLSIILILFSSNPDAKVITFSILISLFSLVFKSLIKE